MKKLIIFFGLIIIPAIMHGAQPGKKETEKKIEKAEDFETLVLRFKALQDEYDKIPKASPDTILAQMLGLAEETEDDRRAIELYNKLVGIKTRIIDFIDQDPARRRKEFQRIMGQAD